MISEPNYLDSIGYFDKPEQVEPAFDPAGNGICPLCQEKIGDRPRLARSLMVSTKRSYFFSYHTECRDDDKLKIVEGDWDEAA
jgi:hypothetical protein